MPIGDLLAQITGKPNSDSEKPVYDDKNQLNRKSNSQTQRPLSTSQRNSRPEDTIRVTVPLSKSATPKSSETKLSRDVSSGTNKKPLGSSTSKAVPDLQNREIKQPKKGSYAEIMARGKAAHAILGQVGRITHKNIERPPSKREREEKKTQMSLKKSKTSTSNETPLRLDHKKERYTGRVTPEPPKRIKKAALATTGYTGTARPKISGPPRVSGSGSTRKDLNERRSSSKPTNRYLSEDEEEEEYNEEDQHYESDLSDMEADAFEVDEEEEIAAKIARREDAEALAEENRLKREKEAKRKKLAAMAKSRSGRR